MNLGGNSQYTAPKRLLSPSGRDIALYARVPNFDRGGLAYAQKETHTSIFHLAEFSCLSN